MRDLVVAALFVVCAGLNAYRFMPQRLDLPKLHVPRVPGVVYCGDFASDTNGRVMKRSGILIISDDNRGFWIGDGDKTLYKINLSVPVEYHACGTPLEGNNGGWDEK